MQNLNKIVFKINALLARTDTNRGATENEASNAAKLVQEMLIRHNLTMTDVNDFTRTEELGGMNEFKVASLKSCINWKRQLMDGISSVNMCKFFTRQYSSTYGNKLRTDFCLVGRESNVNITKEMYIYLSETIERLSSLAMKNKSTYGGKTWANSFKKGCVLRIIDRLQERKNRAEKEGMNGDGNALVVCSMYDKANKEISKFLNLQNIKLIKRNPIYNKFSTDGWNSGKNAANTIGLDTQVKSKKMLRIGS